MTGLAGEERSNLKMGEFENEGSITCFLISSPFSNVVNLQADENEVCSFSNYHIFKFSN
jgi:hypothetical protein